MFDRARGDVLWLRIVHFHASFTSSDSPPPPSELHTHTHPHTHTNLAQTPFCLRREHPKLRIQIIYRERLVLNRQLTRQLLDYLDFNMI